MKPNASLFSDFLTQLGVTHTADYSNAQFAAMPFQSLFGLTKLLQSYGVESEALRIADKSELKSIPVPFLADTPDGFVVVTSVGADGTVGYLTQSQPESAPIDKFLPAWNGVVLLAHPSPASREPGYAAHRRMELIGQAKVWLLRALVVALFAYLFVSNKIYAQWSTILLAVFDLCGLWLSYMLVQKSLNIQNHTADRVCGILEKGGCDSILELKVSSFFGIFKWSEVGFAYFSVSLLALLIFPQALGWLALCNVCCLPYTFWSIWYQRFRAHRWCTLCVSVQTTLWLLFFCYLFGGWLRMAFPLGWGFFVLGATYVATLLALNHFLPMFDNKPKNYEAQDDIHANA